MADPGVLVRLASKEDRMGKFLESVDQGALGPPVHGDQTLQSYKMFKRCLIKFGLHDAIGQFYNSEFKQSIFNKYLQARCFSLDDKIVNMVREAGAMNNPVIGHNYELKPLPLPFRVCWYEGNDTFLYTGKYSPVGSNETFEVSCGAILLSNEETCIHVVAVCHIIDEQGGSHFKNIFSILPYDTGVEEVDAGLAKLRASDPFARFAYITMRNILDFQKSSCALAERPINFFHKIGTGRYKKIQQVKTCIDVVLKKDRKEYEVKASRKVDWTHRWEVMGHWRRVKGMGKDQSGKYKVQGYTWVKDFEKGPAEAHLIKKDRNVYLE